MYISELNLVNFRNYESLRLELEPGLVLIEGGNGQGKSNLLEAIYMLSIAKSPRAGVERELIRRQPMETEVYTQVSAAVHRGS
ncbi:MAG: AAA family ATPase, partial [Chloroflexi bacterium]|nr:AAA family ATPase [Chloroflexota bacterium]